MVKPMLNANVTSKIAIFGSRYHHHHCRYYYCYYYYYYISTNRNEWLPVFKEVIGIENLPSTYGGQLPALSDSVHPYEEMMSLMTKDKERYQLLLPLLLLSSSLLPKGIHISHKRNGPGSSLESEVRVWIQMQMSL